MGSLGERMKLWWSSLDRSQRPIWLMGAAFLALLVVGAMVLAGRPQTSLLFAGLSPADQGMVVEELNALGIRAEYDANGNVVVPANRVNEARARLAVAKKLPQSGNLGYGTIDSINMTTSPAVEREKIKAAIEGELANSILSMQSIAGARVHLTLPGDTPFAREREPSRASIIITEESGQRISPDQASAIVRLVQFGVSGLKPEQITLVNAQGMTLFDGSQDANSNGMAATRLAAEIDEAKRRQRDLQQQLDIAFGAGNTIVSIPLLTLNFDKVSETSIERGPSKAPTVKESVSEKMSAGSGMGPGGTAAIGEAGSVSNTQPGEPPPADQRAYNNTQVREQFETNETQRVIQRSAGDLEAMTLSVMVNQTAIADPAPVQQFVQNYLGPLGAQPDRFQASVTAVPFDVTQREAAQAASSAASNRAQMQQLMALLPVVALLFVGFLVIKAIAKGASQIAPPLPEPAVAVALPGGRDLQIPMSALETLPVTNAQVEQVGAGDRVIAIEGGELASALHAIAQSQHQQVNIGEIPDRVNVPLEQLKMMATQRPESVANLLKTWLMEERR